ncbi:MAG: hypothetical protein J6Q39_03650 [Bacteroidales bacterium]|nr:hypothetical protein [Bacteroidales bacterium]
MSKGTSKTMTVIKMLPLLQYVFPEIKNAFYHVDQDTQEEYVSVRYVNIVYAEALNRFIEDRASNAVLKINVTADSPSALVDDVWRECKRRFG